MAVKHTRLARNCQVFSGTTRAVYKTIADHASPGKAKNWDPKSGKKWIPEGWTTIGYARMMMENHIFKVQTLSDALKELVEAGAIEIKTVKANKWIKFVSEFAEKSQWNDEHIEWFRCRASFRYRTKKTREAAELSVTPNNGVSYTANGCKEEELHRDTANLTPRNSTVVHPSEIVHLSEESSSAYVSKFTTVGGVVESLSLLSQDQQQSQHQTRTPNPQPVQRIEKPVAPRPTSFLIFDDDGICRHKQVRAACPRCEEIRKYREECEAAEEDNASESTRSSIPAPNWEELSECPSRKRVLSTSNRSQAGATRPR